MGEAPSLPEEMGEAKRQAFNKIVVEVTKLLPAPPDNIQSRTYTHSFHILSVTEEYLLR
jgi:hypothetical protein